MVGGQSEEEGTARIDGEPGERTTTRPAVHQPQTVINLAGTIGDWPKYETARYKEYALDNPRNRDHAETFFGTLWKEFSKQNSSLRRKIRSQLRSMRTISDQTRMMQERGRLVEEKKKAQYLALEKVGDEIEIAVKTSEIGYQTLLDKLADWEEGEDDTELLINAVELDKKNQTMMIQYTVGEEEAALEEICGPRPSSSSTADSSFSSSTSTPPTWRRKLGTGIWFTKKVLKINCNALDFQYWIKEQEAFWSDKFEGTVPTTREARWQFADSIMDNDWVQLIRSRARNLETWQDVLALMQTIMHQRDPQSRDGEGFYKQNKTEQKNGGSG